MKAEEKTFISILSSGNKICIPFFQRRYRWELQAWEKLWTDLYSSYEDNYSHFIGSVILRRQGEGTGCNSFDLIDGQQRFTSFSLLIKAIADVLGCLQYNDNVKRSLYMPITEENQYREPVIKHSKFDRELFNNIITNEYVIIPENFDFNKTKDKSKSDPMLRCYAYFKHKAERVKQIHGEDKLKGLLDKILHEKLWVEISIQDMVEAQRVFDSINTTGLPLSKFDIIKNYLLQNDNDIIINNLYESKWKETFEKDDNLVSFWDKEIYRGRLKWFNCDLLVYHYALIKDWFNPEEDRMESISEKYKKNTENADLITIVGEFCDYGSVYHEIFNQDDQIFLHHIDDMKNVHRLIYILQQLDQSTFLPLVLFIAKKENDKKISETVANASYKHIEKYIVYRAILKEETKSYNKMISSLIKKLNDNQSTFKETIIDTLKIIEKETIKDYLTRGIENNSIAKFLLIWIEVYKESISNKKGGSNQTIALKLNFHLEHLMPKSWYQYWPLSNNFNVYSTLEEIGISIEEIKKNDDKKIELLGKHKDEFDKREDYVNKLGNFTLLTGELNQSIKNFDWYRKINGNGSNKENYIKKYNNLQLNKEICEKNEWSEQEIEARTIEFIEIITTKIWN